MGGVLDRADPKAAARQERNQAGEKTGLAAVVMTDEGDRANHGYSLGIRPAQSSMPREINVSSVGPNSS